MSGYFKQQVSEDIFKTKYCLHDGDNNWDQVAFHIAEEISMAEKHRNRTKWQDIFYQEIVSGRFIPGGRILANARIYSPMKNYSNCFTIGIDDDMESIFNSLTEDAVISKAGGGVGFNVSKIRPKGTPLSTGGTASGPMSFLEIFNTSASTIKTGGNRRSAHIAIMDVSHPDIEEFITYKQGDGNKRLTNFNISVAITESFMEAVELYTDWDLVYNGKVYKTVKAKDLYNLITTNAFTHNEPGVYFVDTANKFNNGWWAFDMNQTNPCLSADTVIAVADGRNGVPIYKLAEEGKPFPVYSGRYNGRSLSGWKPEIKQAMAFQTGTKETITVNLSDGTSFICTPDHLLALDNGTYIEAQDSKGKYLGKFYSFSNKNTDKSYRHINSKTNGYARQYRMIWEYYNGEYSNEVSIHHIDFSSTNDSINNLMLVENCMMHHDRMGDNNPIKKADPVRQQILQRHKNVLGNAKRYGWDDDTIAEKLADLPPVPPKEDVNIDLSELVFVESITPGLVEPVYDLTVEDNHNFYIITKTDDDSYLNSSGVLVHNCGEICMPEYSLCDLGAVNLTKFVIDPFTTHSRFDYNAFAETCQIGVRFLDDVLDRTTYPLPKIEKLSKQWRRIGLGITGLADAMVMLNYTYGQHDSLMFVEDISQTLERSSYMASIDLAREKGKFPACDKAQLAKSLFIRRMDENMQYKIRKYGLRNIGLNTIAPTGTTSLSIGNNCSSGIEPIFSLEYTRTIRNATNEGTRQEKVMDYAWQLYNQLKDDDMDVVDDPPFVTTKDINGMDAIKVQALLQRNIDHSISKTHNLKPGTTLEEYQELFRYAWLRHLKGFTTFNPDGSMKGILEYSDKPKEVSGNHAEKRPKTLPCDIYYTSVGKEDFLVLIGKREDGSPYEIFVTTMEGRSFDTAKMKTGGIDKVKKGWYNLIINDTVIIEDISKEFDSTLGTLSRFISMSLRHNVPLQFIVEQLHKGNGFASFEKVVGRILKKYIPSQEKVLTSVHCPDCGADLMYVEGCKKCSKLCGWEVCS